MAVSLARAGIAAAAIEVTKGTRPTMAANTHGFELVDSAVPMPFEQNISTIQKQSTALGARNRIPTTRLWKPALTTFLQGGATATTMPRWFPLLGCAGFSGAAGGSNYTLALETTDIDSATIVTEQGDRGANKITREVNGAYGSCRIFGSVGQEWRVGFTGEGTYSDETLGTITSVIGGAFDPGPTNEGSPLLSGSTRLKINNGDGGGDYFGCINAVNFATNTAIIRKLDLNAGATGGLGGIFFDDFDPVIEINFAQDPLAAAAVSDLDFYQDIDEQVSHDINFAWVDAGGRTMTFDITGTPFQLSEVADGPFLGNNVSYQIATMTIVQT